MSSTSFTAGQATSTSRVPVRARGQLLGATVAGVLFGFGLSLSTMIQPKVVLDFLTLQDFGLMLVLGGAVLVTFIAYRLLPRVLKRPLLGGVFGQHESIMDRQTIIGAAIFGVGWGICGVCPGRPLPDSVRAAGNCCTRSRALRSAR